MVAKCIFFEDGVIPEDQFANRTDIVDVAIGSGITQINKSAFYGCDSLTNVLIKGNITLIGDSAFAYCYSLVSFKYYGTTIPVGHPQTTFRNSSLTSLEVNKNYSGDTFCGLNVDKVL